jgi:hypothetical protein
MATTRITLRPIKRKKQSLYQLDYTVNGKRIRTTVGSNKKDAELVRAKIHSDLSSESMEYLPQGTNPFPLKT